MRAYGLKKVGLWEDDIAYYGVKNPRAQIKREAKEEIDESLNPDADAEFNYEFSKETDEAMYCHHYGPCESCREK